MKEVQSGFLFVPDINGFTSFVKGTDVELGKYVTQQLLSAIIESNTLGLQISEIEGDAILFYKLGTPPSEEEISSQFAWMLTRFNEKLKELSFELKQKFDLSLKLIVHYGKIAEYSINGFDKLYGQPVIEVHRLLKNSVALKQYILFTSDYSKTSKERNAESRVQNCEQYEGLGKICYTYQAC